MNTDEKTLIEQYGGTVGFLARQLRAQYRLDVPLEDLQQTGMEGLLEAFTRFDASRGHPFWAFAKPRVRGAILDSLKQQKPVASTVVEVAPALEDHDHAEDPLAAKYRAINALAAEWMLACRGAEVESPERALQSKQGSAALWRAVATLPARERETIELHYVHHVPFAEIAQSFGIDKFSMSRLYRDALHTLRLRMSRT